MARPLQGPFHPNHNLGNPAKVPLNQEPSIVKVMLVSFPMKFPTMFIGLI